MPITYQSCSLSPELRYGLASFARAGVLALAFGFFLTPAATHARPEMAGSNGADRFAVMDTDKSGALSREEFFAAQPHMKDAAFDAIDTDKNASIVLEEWQTFSAGHGKDAPVMPPTGGHIGETPAGNEPRETAPGFPPKLIMPARPAR